MDNLRVSRRTALQLVQGISSVAVVFAACMPGSLALGFGLEDIRKRLEKSGQRIEEAQLALENVDQVADSVQALLEQIAPQEDTLPIDTLAVFGLTDSIAPMDSIDVGLDDRDSLETGEEDGDDVSEDEEEEQDEDEPVEDEPSEDE